MCQNALNILTTNNSNLTKNFMKIREAYMCFPPTTIMFKAKMSMYTNNTDPLGWISLKRFLSNINCLLIYICASSCCTGFRISNLHDALWQSLFSRLHKSLMHLKHNILFILDTLIKHNILFILDTWYLILKTQYILNTWYSSWVERQISKSYLHDALQCIGALWQLLSSPDSFLLLHCNALLHYVDFDVVKITVSKRIARLI